MWSEAIQPSVRRGEVDQNVRFEFATVRLVEQLRRLAEVEPQVVCAELGDLTGSPQPRERDRSAAAGWRIRTSFVLAARSAAREARKRASAASSTRWKSSRIRTAPPTGSGAVRRGTCRATCSRRGPPGPVSASSAGVCGAKAGIVLAAGGDEVVEKRHPVAVVRVQPVPERPQCRVRREKSARRSSCRSRRRRGRARPGLDLGAQPVEQARPRERLVAERRTLDLGELDRVAAHLVAQVGAPWRLAGSTIRYRADGIGAAPCRSTRGGLSGQPRTIRTARRRVNGVIGEVASGMAPWCRRRSSGD